MEKTGKVDLEDQLAQLRASLASAESERDRFKGVGRRRRRRRRRRAGQGRRTDRRSSKAEKQISARALAQVEVLNQQIAALRRQLAALEQALDASEKKDKESQSPHRRSRPAAQRGAGAARAGTVALPLRLLRQAARDPRQPAGHAHRRRPLRVAVGSVLRHRQGRPAAGRPRRARQGRRPRWSNWTSKSPPTSPGCCASTATPTCGRSPAAQFQSNWDLSAARAIAVVQYLIGKGISPQRLVAAGFGEFQPIDTGNAPRTPTAATAASS